MRQGSGASSGGSRALPVPSWPDHKSIVKKTEGAVHWISVLCNNRQIILHLSSVWKTQILAIKEMTNLQHRAEAHELLGSRRGFLSICK